MGLPTASDVLVIGLGNDCRGDDAAGLVLARRLKAHRPEGVAILEQSGDGAALMESWRGAHAVIILDAAHSGCRPGTIHRLDARTQPIPSSFFCLSTHAFGLAEAIQVAASLGELPAQLIVYGIEAGSFKITMELSSEVENALPMAESRVRKEIKKLIGGCEAVGS